MEYRVAYEACPLCGSTELKNSVVGDCSKHALYNPALPSKMQWKDCGSCGHQFLEGYFTDEALDIVFGETHENQKVGFQLEQQRMIWSRVVDRVYPFQSSGVWLDVGFGNGSLLFTAQEYGFVPVGIDLRKQNVETMNSVGINAYCNRIESISFSQKFAVVSMMDVLEHVPYPKVMLGAAVDNLEGGGCVVISMPNSENIVWKLMSQKNANPYLGELEHYHNFSRTRLYALLEEFGLKPLRYGVSDRYRVCMEVIAQKPE